MKIHQVHRSGGGWEDYYNYIVASYLHEENAIKKKEELEEKQNKRIEQSKKCDECYAYYYEDIGFEHCDEDCFIKGLGYEGEIVCENESVGYVYSDTENYFIEAIEIEDA